MLQHHSLSLLLYTASYLFSLFLSQSMDLLNSVLNFVAPPASMVMLAFAWPTLTFLRLLEWIFLSYTGDVLEDKVVVVTGASSAIGEQIAYEYARRRANLVLVARKEQRLHGIREIAQMLGAKTVLVMAADVVKEEECRRFIGDTISYFGRLDHLVNTVSLGHAFFIDEVTDTSVFPLLMDINFWGNVYPTYVALPHLRKSRGRIVVNASIESWLPMPRMSLYAAAKAAVMNFYESLRYEVEGVGITVASHGLIASDMSRGRFMVGDGAEPEIQWKEDTEVPTDEWLIQQYAKQIVDGACRGDDYVKYPRWYDVFLLYRVLSPAVLGWTFRILFGLVGTNYPSLMGAGRPLPKAASPLQALPEPPMVSEASDSPVRPLAAPGSPARYYQKVD